MEKRKLGNTDMHVSVLGFGGSEIGYERTSLSTVKRLLNSALDAGLNIIDTAECYVMSEELIGNAVSQRRKDYHLLTKCGHESGWGNPDWRP
jgi:aryl-alcohol dehydrogenase-like predicted oxidoreductase